MDFIERLSMFKDKNVIMVVVDRLTKYSHFLGLYHPISAASMAKLFLDGVCKLHGIP